MSAYDEPMASDDLVTELAARAFRKIVERRRSDAVVMRLSRGELERLGVEVDPPWPRHIDEWFVSPDDVKTAA